MGTRREPVRNGRRGATAVPSEISQATSRSEDLTFPLFPVHGFGFFFLHGVLSFFSMDSYGVFEFLLSVILGVLSFLLELI